MSAESSTPRSVSIKIDDKVVVDALERIYRAGADPAPLLRGVGEILSRTIKEDIEAERSPDGKPYAPLNALYAETKKGPGILRGEGGVTGGLAAIVYQLVDGARSLEVGTTAPYARVHQFGATIRPKNAAALVFSMGGKTFKVASVTVPARPFLGVSKDAREEIEDLVAAFFGDVDGAAGAD